MRARGYRPVGAGDIAETRPNPGPLPDDLILVGGMGLLAFLGWGVYQSIKGLPALGQAAGGALSAAGSAVSAAEQGAGQAVSNAGSVAHDAVTGTGNFLTQAASAITAFKPTVAQTKLAIQWRQAAAANAGGSDPNDWNAFRAFAQQVAQFDPGATPWAGWPHAFGGTVFFVGSQQYE